jgi:hypothetical protein
MARELAHRIVAAGEGRVRRVAIIGARANGTATQASDPDLVVLIETAGSALSTADQVLAEKQRLIVVVRRPSLPTDLTVRTTDAAQCVPLPT